MEEKTGTGAHSPQMVCPRCGFANPGQFRFCGSCGAPLVAAARTAAETPTPRPQPERRQLTVLFCDLVGSSALSTRLDPEELRDLIRAYQEASTGVIRRFGGSISRYVGDGIRALFGYPLAHEDDAERAVRAALDVVRAVSAASVPGSVERLAVRIGVATGLVVVGDVIGQGVAEEEAVLGETPNLAARLQGLGPPDSIVISAGTRALLGERFEYADLGVQTLHGFQDPVHAWRVLSVRPFWTRFRASSQALGMPLVGREEHLDALLRTWREAAQSGGRIVVLSGEPGIGKSRVVEALREKLERGTYLGAPFQCSPHYTNTALYPVIEHMGRSAGIGAEDSAALKLAKLSKWLGRVAEKRDALALLGALLSIDPDPRYPLPAMSPRRQKERTLELLLEYLKEMSDWRPVLAVLEDLHWIDPTTQEFLSLLTERISGMRVLAVLTCRPGFSAPWLTHPSVEVRQLEKLPTAQAVRLAGQVAGERLPKEVIEHLVARTDGVPLFIEELTRAVVDTGVPAEQQGRGALRQAPPSPAIPSTLRDSLMARLDQLGPAKLVAQVAGAIGREFSYDLLKLVVPLDGERLREGLRVLEDAGLAYAAAGDAPAAAYAFKHALVQEAAYGSLLHSRRRELHRTIAQALESYFPQTARDAPELVAYHWTEDSDMARAVDAWTAAGRRASERSEYREAIAHLRRALEVLQRLPADRAALEQGVDIRFELRNALLALGEVNEMLQCLKEIEPLLHELGDTRRKARYSAFRCNYHFIAGEQEEAIRFGNLGLQDAPRGGDSPVTGELLYRMGQSYYALGRYREAIGILEDSLRYTADERERGGFDLIVIPSVVSRTWLVSALVEHGDFAPAAQHARRALEIARDADHPSSAVLARLAQGVLLLRKGDFDGAVAVMEVGLELCDRWSLRVWRPRLASTLGVACGRVGRAEEGLELARQALADAEQMQMKVDRAPLLVRLGQASLINGRIAEAIALGTEAVDIARARQAVGDEAWARFLIARAAWVSQPQNLEQLAGQFETALGLAEACEARPLAAFCRTMLGAVHSRRGDSEAALRYATLAEAVYTNLGMRPLPLDPVG